MAEAAQLLRDAVASGHPAQVMAYVAVVAAAADRGEERVAAQTLHDMEASGVEVNIIHLNQLINLFANTGEWERAWGIMGLIARRNLRPVGTTYAQLMKACDTCGAALACAAALLRVDAQRRCQF